jgi:hypothetical protein
VEARAIIDQHLPRLDRGWRPTVERLIEVIVGELPEAQHERKWGQLTFTRNGDWHHWICAVSPTKRNVKLVMHKGALLADPQRAMEEYLRQQVGNRALFHLLFENRIFQYFATAAPGAKELVTVGKVWELAQTERPWTGASPTSRS